jgi:hypothetical protein
LVTILTVSAGPIGVSVPPTPFGAFHMLSTTGAMPSQWNCTLRPET